MEFSFQRVHSQMENDDHTRYNFNYTSFSDHERLWSRTSVGGVEILRESVDMSDAIERREREKDRIRMEIMAEEEEEERRRRVLEAEVRRELMLEKQINGGGGYHRSSSMFMIGPPIGQLTTRFQPVMPTVQPFGPPAVEIYGVGRDRCEVGRFWSPGDGEPKVINLPNGPANNPPLPSAVVGGSSGIKHCSDGGEIGLGIAPKKPVKKQQPSSIKNSRKCVSMDSKKEDKKTELLLWCSMCGVGATSETGMIQHKEGKKHMKNLEKLNRESRGHRTLGVRKRASGMKPKKTNRKQKSHKAAKHR